MPFGHVQWGSSAGSDGRVSVCNAGDLGLIHGSGRSPREGHRYPLQYSCLESPMDRGTWQATVHGVARVGHDWATTLPRAQYIPRYTLSLSLTLLSSFISNLFNSQFIQMRRQREMKAPSFSFILCVCVRSSSNSRHLLTTQEVQV